MNVFYKYLSDFTTKIKKNNNYLFICDQLKGIDGRSHFHTVLMFFKRKNMIEIRKIPILKNKICGYLPNNRDC